MRKLLIVCVFVLCSSKSYSQCKDDECYQYYQKLVEKEKDNIQKIFDGILEEYGDVDGDLRNLLKKLNNTILKADLNLSNLEKENNDINNINTQSNSTLLNLLEKSKHIEKEMKNFTENPRNWPDEIYDANKTANLIIIPAVTLNNVEASANELKMWKTFLEKFDVNNYAKDIMNIPHSVSEDLLLLETLLNENQENKCFSKFHEDLKTLFAQLAGLLDFQDLNKILDDTKKKAQTNKNDANEIRDKTEKFLEDENIFKDIHNLTNETLVLAEEIDELTKSIDDLSKNNDEILNQKLQDLQKSHNADLKKLYKRFKVNEFEILLDELEDINKRINDLNNGENTNIDTVKQEIEGYIDDIDYYSCILEDCRYRKPSEAVNTYDCNKKNAEK